jgi:hypothetical protein
MFTDKEILKLSVKVLGEMMRSPAYNEVIIDNMCFDAVRYAVELSKSLKEIKKEVKKGVKKQK